MSQIKFEQISLGNGNNSRVGFFSLKNDGDEAIVRIMHDSTDTFDIMTTHPIQLNNRFIKVNCIRDPREPIENCPLCKNGTAIQQRIFIHLIQYVKEEDGKIIPVGKVWERAASFAVTLKNLIDEYGPLSDCIFKIRRNGEAGSKTTNYSILYGNPQVYRNDLYVKDDSIFEDYTALGNAVLDKSFEDIAEYILSGEFPSNKGGNNNTPPVAQTPEYAAPPITTQEFVPTANAAPQRPVRYY